MSRQTKSMNKIVQISTPTAANAGTTITTADTATSPTTNPVTGRQLSVAQMLVLGTAAQRPDHMVLPLPSTLRLRAGGQTRLLTALVKAALVEEVPVSDDALCWRRDADDQQIGLRLTEAGLAAVQIPAPTSPTAPAPRLEQEPRAAPKRKRQALAGAPTAADAADAERPAPVSIPVPPPVVATPAQPARPGGKLGQVLSAVSGGTGATLAELISLTGWQAHTTRAALAGLRRRGFAVHLSDQQGRKAYRLDTVA
jgi:hypothetical protein